MKTLLLNLFIAALLCLTPSSSQALQLNQDVSIARARELGIVLKSNPDGENGIKVWLEFEPTGVLKDFIQVDLEIGAPGKRTVVAPLMLSRSAPEKTTPEKIRVYFSADPEMLTTSILTIVVQPADRDRIGLRIKVKDFVEPGPKKAAWARPVLFRGL
jgi:hypothetical protein